MEDYAELIQQGIDFGDDNNPPPDNTPPKRITQQQLLIQNLIGLASKVLHAHNLQGTYLTPQQVSRTTLRKMS